MVANYKAYMFYIELTFTHTTGCHCRGVEIVSFWSKKCNEIITNFIQEKVRF